MHSYLSQAYSTAKEGIKMYALGLCFVSAACFSASIAFPNAENSIFFLQLFVYFPSNAIAKLHDCNMH